MSIMAGFFEAKRERVKEETIIRMAKITLFKIIAMRATETVMIPTIQYQSAVFSLYKYSLACQDSLLSPLKFSMPTIVPQFPFPFSRME